jgi:hypothetical protein
MRAKFLSALSLGSLFTVRSNAICSYVAELYSHKGENRNGREQLLGAVHVAESHHGSGTPKHRHGHTWKWRLKPEPQAAREGATYQEPGHERAGPDSL